MIRGFVAKKNIDLVIDGLENFLQQTIRARQFSAIDMKNFMEPIFSQADYRDPVTNGGGGDGRINILLIHDSGVGDFVNKSAAIKEIRRLYPTAHITMIVFPRALDLAENCPYVDEVIPNERKCDWHDLSQIYRWHIGIARYLLRRRFDLVYAFAHYPSSILLSYMCGALERISYKFTPENGAIECGPFYIFSPLLTVEVPHQLYGTHSVDNALALVDHTLRAPVVDREPEVWFTPLDRANLTNLLRNDLDGGNKLYALCMGGSSPRKQWLPERYAQLVMKILKREPDIKFVILGGGPMDERSAAIFKQSLDQKALEHVADLTGRINYRQSAALLSLCDMYIGNDTGSLHIAAAVKVPVLTMNCFAAELPQEKSIPSHYFPYHVPSVTVQPKKAPDDCRHSKDPYGCIVLDRPHCIAQITVETAFDAYNRLKKRIAEKNIEPLFIS